MRRSSGTSFPLYQKGAHPGTESQQSLKVHRWVKVRRWVRSTFFSLIHRVDVMPRFSVDNIVRTVFAFKQVDEMEILPTERLTYSTSADQRLEQHLPDHVDLMLELDEHYVALRIIGTLLLLHLPGEGATTACQVLPEQLDRVLLHPGQVSAT